MKVHITFSITFIFIIQLADPSKIIVRDMREVRNDCEEEKTHGVVMWDANLMQLLQDNPKVKAIVEGKALYTFITWTPLLSFL